MIQTTILGRLGRDASVKDVNGKKVIEFVVATDKGYGDNKKTIWCDCSLWRDNTNIAQYLTKGSQVLVIGEPDLRAYKNKEGEAKAALSIRVDKVEFAGGKQNNEQSTGNGASESVKAAPIPDAKSITEPIDDLPF